MTSLILASRYDGVMLELTPAPHPFDGEFAELPTWEAHLTAAGLDAVLVCPEADAEQTLADYFAALYETRMGWDGERSWSSQADGMRLTAVHDQINTVHMKIALEGGGVEPRWHSVADVYLDPGVFQQLSANARLYGDALLTESG
jgi:hypothetical protein